MEISTYEKMTSTKFRPASESLEGNIGSGRGIGNFIQLSQIIDIYFASVTEKNRLGQVPTDILFWSSALK